MDSLVLSALGQPLSLEYKPLTVGSPVTRNPVFSHPAPEALLKELGFQLYFL